MSQRRARLTSAFCLVMTLSLSEIAAVAVAEPPTYLSVSDIPQTDLERTRTALGPDEAEQPAGKEKRGEVEVDVLDRGDSSSKTLRTAVSQLPLDRLSEKDRERADGILKELSLFRRMPIVSFETDPAAYQFFTQYPDVAVSIWRVLGISKVEMWQTGAKQYEVDGADGSLAVVDVLYKSSGTNLIACDGVYKSPLLPKPIKGKALMNLTTEFSIDDAGKTYATHQVDLFVAFPSTTVETAAKVISPVSNMIADRNFREISLFLRMMSIAMERQPGWVERVADQMEGVIPERKTQLLTTAARIYVRAQKQRLAEKYGDGRRVTEEDVLGPLRAISQGNVTPAPRFAENISPNSQSPAVPLPARP